MKGNIASGIIWVVFGTVLMLVILSLTKGISDIYIMLFLIAPLIMYWIGFGYLMGFWKKTKEDK